MKPSAAVLVLALSIATGLAVPSRATSTPPAAGTQQAAADDTAAPFGGFRGRLLAIATEASSAYPLDPHIKNRSRAQQKVVEAYFQLEQPALAMALNEKIANWRRGLGYAEYALYKLRAGETEGVDELLEQAWAVAEDVTSQQWRRDRIRIRIAQARVLQGQKATAAQLEQDVVKTERGPLMLARAETTDREDVEAVLAALDHSLELGEFDPVRDSVGALQTFYRRFYGEEELREKLEQRIRGSWERQPIMFRFEAMLQLIEGAVENQDIGRAKALCDEAYDLVVAYKWQPADEIQLRARVAAMRHRAGAGARARREAEAAWMLFEAEREQIFDVFRGEPLRVLAEAFVTLGETKRAHEVYARAVEEGLLNPNSRPRADDLTATCCSMALHGVTPSEELWDRLEGGLAGLGDPW